MQKIKIPYAETLIGGKLILETLEQHNQRFVEENMKNFRLYAESRDKQEECKQAVFTALGIDPAHAESRLDDTLESFANKSELQKMPILDELDPEVKGHVIAALNDGNTKLRDLFSIMSREPDTSDHPTDAIPEPPAHATPGMGATTSQGVPSPM